MEADLLDGDGAVAVQVQLAVGAVGGEAGGGEEAATGVVGGVSQTTARENLSARRVSAAAWRRREP